MACSTQGVAGRNREGHGALAKGGAEHNTGRKQTGKIMVVVRRPHQGVHWRWTSVGPNAIAGDGETVSPPLEGDAHLDTAGQGGGKSPPPVNTDHRVFVTP